MSTLLARFTDYHFLQVSLGVASCVGAIVSFYFLWRPETTQTTRKFLLVTWLVLPPIAFWLEYYLFAPDLTHAGSADVEQLKLQLARLNDFRQVSQSIWAGVAAALGALYIKPTLPSSTDKDGKT